MRELLTKILPYAKAGSPYLITYLLGLGTYFAINNSTAMGSSAVNNLTAVELPVADNSSACPILCEKCPQCEKCIPPILCEKCPKCKECPPLPRCKECPKCKECPPLPRCPPVQECAPIICETSPFEIVQSVAPQDCKILKHISHSVSLHRCPDNTLYIGRYVDNTLIGTHIYDPNEVCKKNTSDYLEVENTGCIRFNSQVLLCPDSTFIINNGVFLLKEEFKRLCPVPI